ncbi:MAG: cytochrome P450 [Deltaproteobacteria bacterium]|nr:cytochrome P450 [Deltaproteobacteria bacterium]
MKGLRVRILTGVGLSRRARVSDPDRFDVTRRFERSLYFGHGQHVCLGKSLARLEARVVLEEFLARYPRYQLDEAGLERTSQSHVRGYSRIPGRVDRSGQSGRSRVGLRLNQAPRRRRRRRRPRRHRSDCRSSPSSPARRAGSRRATRRGPSRGAASRARPRPAPCCDRTRGPRERSVEHLPAGSAQWASPISAARGPLNVRPESRSSAGARGRRGAADRVTRAPGAPCAARTRRRASRPRRRSAGRTSAGR